MQARVHVPVANLIALGQQFESGLPVFRNMYIQ
jgi:hypothetical protein